MCVGVCVGVCAWVPGCPLSSLSLASMFVLLAMTFSPLGASHQPPGWESGFGFRNLVHSSGGAGTKMFAAALVRFGARRSAKGPTPFIFVRWMSVQTLPKEKRRIDYATPPFTAKRVDLDFQLFDTHTVVSSNITVEKRTDTSGSNNKNLDLVLDGQDLDLQQVTLDGRELDTHEYSVLDEGIRMSYDLHQTQRH